MYVSMSTSKTDGKNMASILYDENRTPIKTVHFGAEGYTHYTTQPHDK